MNIKPFYKFRFKKYMFKYTVMFAALLLLTLIFAIISFATKESGSINGMEVCSFAFFVAVSIITYKEHFTFALQNGVSRKSVFLSTVLALLTVSFAAAIGDVIFDVVGNLFQNNNVFIYNSFYEQLFGISIPVISDYPKIFLFDFSLLVTFNSLGLLLGGILYRLNTMAKVLAIIGIYFVYQIASFLIVIIDGSLFNNYITTHIQNFFSWIGEGFANITIPAFILSIILFAISFLFMRKAPVIDRKK